MNLRRIIMPLLLAGPLLLTACGGDDPPTQSQSPEQSADAATAGSAEDSLTVDFTAQDINARDPSSLQAGGVLRLRVNSFARNWNPLHIDGNDAGWSEIRSALLPAFFDFDNKGVPTPNPDYVLSVEEVSTEPAVVRYQLNPDAVWGDGSPIDGDDMRAKWLACNGENKAFNCASTESYTSIEDIAMGEDKREVTITYTSAFPDWSQGFSTPGAVKAESINDVDVFNGGWDALNNDWLAGPFKVGSFDETQQILTLLPNERWWGDTPKLEKIVWRTIAADASAQAFANDEIDAFDIASNPDAFQRASRVTDAEIRKAGGPNFRHFTFNSEAGLLKDLKIRQAIVMGLDRQSIAASDLAGIDWPVTPLNNHVFLQNQQGFVDMAEKTGLDYNPERARLLLDEAGWPVGDDGIREKDGQKLVVRFTQLATVKASENEALQAQNQLKDIGIQLDIVTIPIGRFGPTLSGHEFEIIAFSWIGTPYPFSGIAQLYGTGSESNYAQLSMPAVDALAEQIATETDTQQRIALANEAAQLIWENVHTLPLYQRPELIATKATLANYGAFGLGSRRWEHIGYQP